MAPMGDALGNDDALGLAARIRAGELTAAEAVEASIARIEARSELNAVVGRRFEEALDEARAGLPEGPFTGVPFLVKDLGAEIAGVPATRGSRLWADHVPGRDSEAVARYRAAGLVLLGTTNSPELGRNASTEPQLHGPTHNPWRTGYSPGGSSGGSAAAVAAGLVPAAHGNDGGGSIRIPASMCGLFGLKPTRGRVPADPARGALAYPLGINHALTTTVRDSAALLDAVAGAVPGPAYAAPAGGPFLPEVGKDPGRLRIALSLAVANGTPVDPGSEAATRRAAEVCEALGHEIEEADLVYPHQELMVASSAIMSAPLAHAVEERLLVLGRALADDDLETFTRWMVDRAAGLTATQYVAALETVEHVGNVAGAFFERYDVLLTPTMAPPVPAHGYLDTTSVEAMFERAGAFSALTAVFNATGQPAMSVPFGTDSGGMPTGAQFVGRFGEEATLLRLAGQLEVAAPWARHAPGS